MKLSHSKLSLLLSCPMSYYLSYEQQIMKKDIKAALWIGSAVHWGIEHDTEDLTEYFNDNGREKNRDNYSREQLLAEAMVHGYRKHKDELYEKILTDIDGNKLTLVDEQHELFVNASLPSAFTSEAHTFVGIIDLLLLTDKGWVIIDYKTSSYEPDWNGYLDQIYRYIFLLRDAFPEVPVYKIGIINIRKTNIRQKKTENNEEFLNRLRFEYDVNDENYVNYHEFNADELDEDKIKNYIYNLSKMSDCAQTIVDNKLWYINYSAANGQYGKSDYWDIFYHTPNAELLYSITDKIYDIDEAKFVTKRDCVDIDMKVCDYSNVLNKYTLYKNIINEHKFDPKSEEAYNYMHDNYIVNDELLLKYCATYYAELLEATDSES